MTLLVVAVGCHGTWTTETKNGFYKGCTTRALAWSQTPALAQEYCDCVFLTISRKYPVEEDAMRNMDNIANDPDVLSCKEQMTKQVLREALSK